MADEVNDSTGCYISTDITVLRLPECVRLRPGMYIGDVCQRGLHRVFFQLAAGSIAESTEWYGRSLKVVLKGDGSAEIADDCRGSTLGTRPTKGKPVLETLLTECAMRRVGHRGRDWSDYAIANALSEWFQIEIRHAGKLYAQEYRRGDPMALPRLVGTCAASGVKVRFKPDPAIFPDPRFSYGLIRDRLREYAFLHSGLRISVADETTGNEEQFDFEDGIRSFVEMLNRGRQPLHEEILVVLGKEMGITYQVGLQWCQERDEIIRSFVNDNETVAGGSHVTGLKDAVTRSLNSFLRERGQTVGRVLNGDETRQGLTAIVSVRMVEPRFYGATKDRFINKEAQTAVATGVKRFLRPFFDLNPEVAEAVVQAATSYR